MKIKQYRPNYYSGFDNEEADFNSVDELLNISWVKNFSNDRSFYRYSVSDDTLMAECNNGYDWYVVGILDSPVSGLPNWRAKHRTPSKKQIIEEKRKQKLELREKQKFEKQFKSQMLDYIKKITYETMA